MESILAEEIAPYILKIRHKFAFSGNTANKGGENVETYFCKTKILVDDISALKKLGARRLMVVADPFFAENGTAELTELDKFDICV